MARNEEKQYARLNRLLLQQQKEEDLKKNPPRPKLGALNTVKEIKKWLPSIIRDIDFNLTQSQVACYPDRKISELRAEVDRLQRVYKAFVRKLKELDPKCEVIPWTERAYSARKRPLDDNHHDGGTDDTCSPAAKQKVSTDKDPGTCTLEDSSTLPIPNERIALPILDGETEQDYAKAAAEQPAVIWNCDPDLQDKPLDFHSYKRHDLSRTASSSGAMQSTDSSEVESSLADTAVKSQQQTAGMNALGLDYDSSDDDDGGGG